MSTNLVIMTDDPKRRAVGLWLLFMAFTVLVMVVVGGATRLTESGLSMVNWNPVTGAIPPITEAEWGKEFTDYKLSPEYKLKNHGMSLDEFKGIFYWEWGHRLLGRLIGVFFLLPFFYFLVAKKIPDGLKPRLFGLFILGGLQGLLGWYMVKSGLVDEPAVSHYRLTAHLMLALLIFSALLWTSLNLLRVYYSNVTSGLKKLSHFLLFVLTLQLIMGGLVAGLKAGYIMNTWPLMEGSFIPDTLFVMEPVWANLLENAVTVQFDHRIGAYLLFVLGGFLYMKSRQEDKPVRRAVNIVILTIILQIALGIFMLILHIPVSWGAAHQAGGVILLAAVLNLMQLSKNQRAV